MCVSAATRASPTTGASRTTAWYPRRRLRGGAAHRVAAAADDARLGLVEPRIAGLRRLGNLAPAPRSRCATTARGYASRPPTVEHVECSAKRARIGQPSGPMRSRSDRRRRHPRCGACGHAAAAAAASHPPLIADRCLRTVLSAECRRLHAADSPWRRCLSSRVRPSAGTAISADAPPESSTSSRSSTPADAGHGESANAGPPARLRFGTGWPAVRCSRCASGRRIVTRQLATTTPPRSRSPRKFAAAAAMPAAALPAATSHTRSVRLRMATRASASSTSDSGINRTQSRPGRWPGDRVGDWRRRGVSSSVFGIGPGREPGHDIEFLEEGADDFVGVVFGAELLELAHDAGQGGFDIGDGAFGVIGAVLLETSVMLDELFPVKLGDRVLRADRPRSVTKRGMQVLWE